VLLYQEISDFWTSANISLRRNSPTTTGGSATLAAKRVCSLLTMSSLTEVQVSRGYGEISHGRRRIEKKRKQGYQSYHCHQLDSCMYVRALSAYSSSAVDIDAVYACSSSKVKPINQKSVKSSYEFRGYNAISMLIQTRQSESGQMFMQWMLDLQRTVLTNTARCVQVTLAWLLVVPEIFLDCWY
jgi:hypothetical protein